MLHRNLTSILRNRTQKMQSLRNLIHYFKQPPLLLGQSQWWQGCRTASSTYDNVFKKSVESPAEFWAEQASSIVWTKKWSEVLDCTDPVFPKWFVGGQLSIVHNCLDRHIDNGLGDQLAVIHDSPVTSTVTKFTYNDILKEVTHLAGALSRLGVKKGDCVLIYMPMIPEALISMLAITRLGAYHSLVFGGFASRELSTRISHAKPKVIIAANVGIEPTRTVDYHELMVQAVRMSDHEPRACVIYNRPGQKTAEMRPGLDVDYRAAIDAAKPHDCVPVDPMDPCYVLYTSGTTGLPKNKNRRFPEEQYGRPYIIISSENDCLIVVRPTGGYAVALSWTMKNIFGIKPRDVWWAASDFGWVVGHSYITYGPMLNANPTVIYEGKPVGTPDAGAFFRVIADHGVKSLFMAPTGLRAIRKEDHDCELGKKYNMANLQSVFLAGEHCDVDTLHWAKAAFGVPVTDHWWQTEAGWPITATCAGLDMDMSPRSGVSGKPVPGWNVKVVREDLSETEAGELGRIVIKCPLPPGSFSTLYSADDRFRDLYFSEYEGHYDSMDAGVRDENGYINVMSRADDVINVAGHRLSSGAIEECILEHSDVAEGVVIAVPDSLKGHVPLGVLVLKSALSKPESQVIKEVCALVREHIGPVASFKQAVVVDRLPKTRSGKVARGSIADMAAGKPFKMPVTLEDDTVYPDIKRALADAGFSPSDPII